MRARIPIFLSGLAAMTPLVLAQTGNLDLPKTVETGSAFSVQCTGNGNATLYIVSPGQVLKRDVQLGGATSFPAGSLYNAGRYVVVLSAPSSTETGTLDVVPATKPADLILLAKPSRLPVGLHNGISGTAYVFDVYQNLVTTRTKVSFELSNPASGAQTRTVETGNGVAWTQMDSTPREGRDSFVARVGDVSSTRIIGQVPGDPCSLKMNAKLSGVKIQLETDPVRDCSGNAVPDGTIVTFTEAYNGSESTVDVPLKRGVARVEMPAQRGATISVASGIVLGNQIRWDK